MIDFESDVFDLVSNAVHAIVPNAFVISKESARMPSQFPCVSIVEVENTTLKRTRDSGSNENHVYLTYEVNVYSNKANGSKSECKAILELADEALVNVGFSRVMKHPVSLDDATKYRIVARYAGVSDKNGNIYRR